MNHSSPQTLLWPAILLVLTPVAFGQAQRDPHIAYVYPAGVCRSTEAEVVVGGQYLKGASEVYISGGGIEATVVKHWKFYTQGDASKVREKLDKARRQLDTTDDEGRSIGKRSSQKEIAAKAMANGLTEEELEAYREYGRRRNDPKRQLNPQLAETVTLHLKVAPDAELGKRDLRLGTDSGLAGPICFYVGQLAEYREIEPNDKTAGKPISASLPVVLNGQIMPGDVDRFRFKARKGDRLVMVAAARELVPYLADAVPGWFQATLTLYDATGHEVAYSDDHTFHPDPVLYYKVLRDGLYDLEIKDSIYRGREDFVYRITLGVLPYVTSIFPLGCQSGDQLTLEVEGWNLPSHTMPVDTAGKQPGTYPISVRSKNPVTNYVPFVVGRMAECMEEEPNDDRQTAQPLKPPLIVNGRIDEPGDWDVFQFKGRPGGHVIVEVLARRLNSPMDSVLKLTDADGKQLMINDDHEDKGRGLATHHADSLLSVELPEQGVYYIHLGDTQNKGGPAYGYRLRVSGRQPDFELRVTPSTIHARPGSTVPITVYAMRKDDFSDEIAIALKEPPPGFKLTGGPMPAEKDEVQLTLKMPPQPGEEPFYLSLEGVASAGGREIRRRAVPADDMMQAFIYHHLVTAKDWMISVTRPGKKKGS